MRRLAMPDIADRVAALEATVAVFTRKLFERGDISVNDARAALGYPALHEADAGMTEDQVAEFRRQFDEVMQEPFTYRIIGPLPPLSPDEVRQLLRECVTVVKPGETLVVQVPMDTQPRVVRQLQDFMDYEQQSGRPFPVLIVPGNGMGVVETPGAA